MNLVGTIPERKRKNHEQNRICRRPSLIIQNITQLFVLQMIRIMQNFKNTKGNQFKYFNFFFLEMNLGISIRLDHLKHILKLIPTTNFCLTLYVVHIPYGFWVLDSVSSL